MCPMFVHRKYCNYENYTPLFVTSMINFLLYAFSLTSIALLQFNITNGIYLIFIRVIWYRNRRHNILLFSFYKGMLSWLPFFLLVLKNPTQSILHCNVNELCFQFKFSVLFLYLIHPQEKERILNIKDY